MGNGRLPEQRRCVLPLRHEPSLLFVPLMFWLFGPQLLLAATIF